ncbi:DUF3667 domain-containing protein [Hyphococcus sp.]|uniref:DUF3667 domain-containing protein n=1 Tax=Hyphococcus sp. TaxID=2038636 RepID=UPI003CCC1AFC
MGAKQLQSECQNDHTKLMGAFCHTCGQRADEPRRAVIGLVQDIFVDTLAIDGKLARTIWLLLSRPGRLARRYLDGKRVRYSPPFRLYLFASVFFFIIAFSLTALENGKSEEEASGAASASLEERLAEMEAIDPEGAAELRRALEEADEADKTADGALSEGASFEETPWEEADYNGPDWLEPYLQRIYAAGQFAVHDPRLFIAEVRQNLPRTLLLAPVVYALLLLLLYAYRRKYYVYDHFVVSLYMHGALYTYLLIAMLIAQIPGVRWLAVLPLAWGWLQPFLVFRQAYGSGWISAFLKWAVSVTVYLVLLTLIITLGLTYSLYRTG